MSAIKQELEIFKTLIGVAAASALDGLPGFPPDDIESVTQDIERAAMNVVMTHCGFDAKPDPVPALVSLARRIAELRPATREFNPGIGAGMLNSLIADAKAAIEKCEFPDHDEDYARTCSPDEPGGCELCAARAAVATD